MAKSREKIPQLGFWDPEVSTPDHDSVCLWAYDNADSIIRKVCPDLFDRPWTSEEIRERLGDDREVLERARVFAESTPRPDPRIHKKTLEYVLRSHTGYGDRFERIVGYADILVATAVPKVGPRYIRNPSGYGREIVDGFKVEWSTESEAPRILIEAKSVLPTVGELMRQVQLYRTAFRGKIVVVCPDERYAKILAEQDVAFVKYAP